VILTGASSATPAKDRRWIIRSPDDILEFSRHLVGGSRRFGPERSVRAVGEIDSRLAELPCGKAMMEPKLTDTEWDELVDLIAASPSGRMDEALKHLAAGDDSSHELPDSPPAAELRTTEDWLLHLASISSGEAFDRALLTELRRLSLH
jgi:hypothetical protein